jgi:hypothetical protein
VRRAALVVVSVIAVVAGCRQLLGIDGLDDEPPTDAPQVDDADEDGSPGTIDGTPVDAMMCGAQCTALGGTCISGEICQFDCSGDSDCENAITCPTGIACSVECTGSDSCGGGVDCADATTCEVTCAQGDNTCMGRLRGGSGLFLLVCDGVNSCPDVGCGTGPCQIACNGQNACLGNPVECGMACACDLECNGQNACDSGVVCPASTCEVSPPGCSSTPPGCNTCP